MLPYEKFLQFLRNGSPQVPRIGPKAILVDFQRPNFRFQRGPGEPYLRGVLHLDPGGCANESWSCKDFYAGLDGALRFRGIIFPGRSFRHTLGRDRGETHVRVRCA
jgi:hypothetical protein